MTELNDKCLTCGHKRRQHIYNEGACRPGFVCEFGCKEFVEPINWRLKYERLQKAAIAYASGDNLDTLHELLDSCDVPPAER